MHIRDTIFLALMTVIPKIQSLRRYMFFFQNFS